MPEHTANDSERMIARRNEIDPGTDYVAPNGTLETRLAELMQAALNIDRVGRNDSFFELGGDSLQAIDLLMQIEKALGVVLPPSIIIDHPTIAQLVKVLEGDTQVYARRIVVPLQPDGAEPAIFFIHEASGNLFSYQTLVQHLGRTRKIFGVLYPGQYLDPIPALSVPQMAALYVKAIKNVQPKGPYILIGYSFGGVAAYEMARQLHAQGDRLAALILIDAGTMAGLIHGPQKFIRKLSHHLAAMSEERPSRWPAYVWRAIRKEFNHTDATPLDQFEKHANELSQPEKLRVLIGDILMAALNAYEAPPYPGAIKLLRCTQGIGSRYSVRDAGWGDRAEGGVEVEELPTHHYAALSEPTVTLVAAHVRRWIDQAVPAADKVVPLRGA